MKARMLFIAIFTFIATTPGVLAQNVEGGNDNYNYLNNLDASKTVLTIFQDASILINYQAVARYADGSLITNTAIAVGFDIYKGSAAGPVIYSETINSTTDANGAFSVQIGSVTPIPIDRASDSMFLEVSLDGKFVETTQFVTFPYAMAEGTIDGENLTTPNDRALASADAFAVSGDNTIVGEIVDIAAVNVVTAPNDIVNLSMPAGSSVNAQFIEARNGDPVVFQVQGDGRTLINTTTTAPQLNTVYGNSMPIAYGSVALGFSDIQTGYGITSFANPAVGEYDIVIDHATDMNNCIVVVTPYTGSFGAPEIAGYEPTGANSFKVRIQTAAGVATNSAFAFVVYGNH